MKVYIVYNRGSLGADTSRREVTGGWMPDIMTDFPMLDPHKEEWQWWTEDHTLVEDFGAYVSMIGFDDSCEIGDYIDCDNIRIRRIE